MAFPTQSPQRSLHPPDLHTHLSKLRKVLTCSLCNQLLQKPACLHCNHHFCMSCLLQSLEEMSACPKCKQPAATRLARFAPEMDNLVDIFQNMESAAGPIVANSEDSQLENLPDSKNVTFNVKVEDECLSPSALKRQRRHENRERMFNMSAGAKGGDSRKRDASSIEHSCRGVYPAPKRIQLPCPPLSTDRTKVIDVCIEKKEKSPTTHPILDPSSVDVSSNALVEQQKQPFFACARIGGQARTGSAVSSQDDKVPWSMGFHGSNCEQTKVIGNSLGKRPEYTSIHPDDPAQERKGMHVGPSYQTLPGLHKQDIEIQAGSELADDNARLPNSMLPSQADQSTEKVTCAFCHTSDSEVAGPMIHYKKGVPVSGSKRSGQVFSVHKNCAEWAPGVYYEEDVAKNIPQEVARGHKIKCHVCGLRGAVLGCYVKRCRKSFHYPCAHTLSCRWDDSNFLVFCPEHITSNFPDEGPAGSSSKSAVNVPHSGHKDETPKQAMFDDGYGHQRNGCAGAAASVDVYIPQLCAEVETCKGEHSQLRPSSNWVICGSGLSPRANELLTTFVSYFGLKVEKMWSSCVTHLIVGTDEVGAARRTYKYLVANLEGKWVLKIDWLSACMAANQCVNEEPYEVNLDIHGMIGGPCHARRMAIAKMHKLFQGLRFYFLGEYTAAYRADLEALLTKGGGLLLVQLPDSSERDAEECIVIIYSKDMLPDSSASCKEEINKSRYFEAKSLAGMTGAKVAAHIWILDSVAAYELQPFE
ncbi:hypothetical protein L7F22_068889 [Adiantum nelumboides]|nr:hypothetical protein [Adiantum nelumboides]